MSDKKPQKPAAFIFGKRPETITAAVKFTSVTGAEVDIECQFKYRTRKEFSALWDEISGPVEGQITDEDFSYAKLTSKGLTIDADRTLKFLTAWPLDLELSQESVVQLFDEEPAAPGALWDAYRKTCLGVRQGN